MSDLVLQGLGWAGSALLVYSVMQAAVLRFRVLNLAACLILIVFNALLEIWPMVAMNAALALINAWFLVRLIRERDDERTYAVLEADPGDAYLRHVLSVHAHDIARFQPGFDLDEVLASPGCRTFLVQNSDETVGVVVVQVEGDTAYVRLDYVTARYRDFTPGKFLWRHEDLFRERGITRVVSPSGMIGAYYARVGFEPSGDVYVLDLAGPASPNGLDHPPPN